jgi:cytochrome c biogenesis protein CcmG/thiol:disulfide interchange protein DsbE
MHTDPDRRVSMDIPQEAPSEETRQSVSPAWIAAGAVAVLVMGLLAYALFAQPTETLQVGSPVPDFQLTALDGSSMSLSEQQGNVVVLNIFASWCDPCREEAAALEETWRAYQNQGVQFFGIAYKDADSKAQAFLDEFGVTYPSTVEPENETARAYGVTGVPETFVIDQQGLLVRHFLGAITRDQLAEVLDPLVSQ